MRVVALPCWREAEPGLWVLLTELRALPGKRLASQLRRWRHGWLPDGGGHAQRFPPVAAAGMNVNARRSDGRGAYAVAAGNRLNELPIPGLIRAGSRCPCPRRRALPRSWNAVSPSQRSASPPTFVRTAAYPRSREFRIFACPAEEGAAVLAEARNAHGRGISSLSAARARVNAGRTSSVRTCSSQYTPS